MKKQIDYSVKEHENDLAIKVVLSKSLHLSRREISRLKFTDGLLLNGEVVRVTQPVHTGDIITVIFSDRDTAHAVRMIGRPDILYEDEDLVVVNKPSGMPCHPSREHKDDDMGTVLQNYYGNQLVVRPIGRLDKDVSGVMLYAKNQPAAARLSKQRKSDTLRKEYYAIVQGVFEKDKGTLKYRLRKVNGRQERIISDDGQLCITEYETIGIYGQYSLVKVHIVTGRTHQIRAGMAWAKHPIVGDKLYGGNTDIINKVALHCYHLSFENPFTHKKIDVEAPMRDEMLELLKDSEQ